MHTTELLRVGRASALFPAGRNAGGAFFGGVRFVQNANLDPLKRAVLIPLTNRATAHPHLGVGANIGENMNQDDEDSRGPINPKRELSGHLPADISTALQQAVHEWPKAAKWSRVHQLECEAVRRGLRVPDALMGFGR